MPSPDLYMGWAAQQDEPRNHERRTTTLVQQNMTTSLCKLIE